MWSMPKCLIIYVFVIMWFPVNAQYYSSGADPASTKWSKIETENFKIVFPDFYEEQGQYIAKVMEKVYRLGSKSLNHNPKKVSILVHAQTAYSNGFVTWAPKRMELYTTPHQQMYAQDWIQQLAIHEFRHVGQIDKLNNGFSKMLSFILGDQAIGAVLGLYVPMWFLEGDAVAAETGLSKVGRGRMPEFEQGIRAQVMDKNIYSYNKAVFGSYKDYIPNHYEMGYQLVAGARAKYGAEVWQEALSETAKRSYSITPFNHGIKRVTGINKTHLYQETFDYLRKEWMKQDSLTTQSSYNNLTKKDSKFVNFRFPVMMKDGYVVAQISGPGEISRFVKIDNKGKYTTLYTPGNIGDEPFSYAKNILCWAEYVPDTRWENQMYSVIKTYDISTNKAKIISRKSNYFSPVISPDGNIIAAVYANSAGDCSIVLMDSSTGSKLDEVSYNDNNYLFTPSWNSDGKSIVCVALTREGKQIVLLDVLTKKWKPVTKPSFSEITLPKWNQNNEILFTASYTGKNDIYKVGVEDKRVTQITESKYGATGAVSVLGGEKLLYSNYTADGYQLVSINKSDFVNNDLSEVQDNSIKLYQDISKQENSVIDFSDIENEPDYMVKTYSKWNLFNLHSWAPAFININDKKVSYGASLLSQNLLGTTETIIGYNADSQMSREKYYFNFNYWGWYPVINFEIKAGDQKYKFNGISNIQGDSAIWQYINSRLYQTQFELGTSIPFNLTNGKMYSLLQPSVEYHYYHRTGYSVDKTLFVHQDSGWSPVEESQYVIPDMDYSSMEYGLYFHRIKKSSQRDVSSRWGQIIEFKYQHNPIGKSNYGSISMLRSRLYFPGLGLHHSIRLDNEYQYKTKGDRYKSNSDFITKYRFGDYFNLPRGYNNQSNDRLYSIKLDYIFPLCNPDLSLGGLMYLKRITSNIFFDYSKIWEDYTVKTSGYSFTQKQNFKSVGMEFKGDVNVFRFLFPLTIGYRYARLIDLNQNYSEFIVGMNISGFSLGK